MVPGGHLFVAQGFCPNVTARNTTLIGPIGHKEVSATHTCTSASNVRELCLAYSEDAIPTRVLRTSIPVNCKGWTLHPTL